MDARDQFWRTIIEKQHRRLCAYCRRTRCTEDDINQIVWDVWQEATEHEARLVEASDPWPVLHAIARARCAMHVRTRRREASLDCRDVAIEDNTLDDSDEWRQSMRTWVSNALARLPDKQRRAVDYRYRWGWPYDVVGAALETAESTARVHAARAIQRLREFARESPPSPS